MYVTHRQGFAFLFALLAVVAGYSAALAQPKAESAKNKLLGKWEQGNRDWEFRQDGYVTGTLLGAGFFQGPDYKGRGYKLKYKVDKDGDKSAQLTLTVMELHTNRQSSVKATVTFTDNDTIEFTFDEKASELASIAVSEKEPLKRTSEKKKK